MIVFCQNRPIAVPRYDNCTQTCYDINADWHNFFLEAIASFVLRVISFKGLLSQ
jgi:hypothetical protein